MLFRSENASCEFDVESLRPTYRLLIGIPGKSNAFAISKKLGLPDYILSDASERLNAEDVHFEDIVSDLEHARISLEKEQAEVKSYKAEIASLKEKLQAKNERLDERTDNIIRNADTGLFEELGYDDILWIDMLQPTIKEQKAVENFMEINLQTKQQDRKSTRLNSSHP